MERIDYDKIDMLRRALYFELMTAAHLVLVTGHRSADQSVRRACLLIDEIEAEMPKIDGFKVSGRESYKVPMSRMKDIL